MAMNQKAFTGKHSNIIYNVFNTATVESKCGDDDWLTLFDATELDTVHATVSVDCGFADNTEATYSVVDKLIYIKNEGICKIRLSFNDKDTAMSVFETLHQIHEMPGVERLDHFGDIIR